MNPILWTPDDARVAGAQMSLFREQAAARHGVPIEDYAALHRWSVTHRDAFWDLLWDFADVRAQHKGERVLIDGDRMPGARFFPDARLNYAANLLRRRDDATAIIFRGEDQVERTLSYAQLYAKASRLAQALRAMGVVEGDRVAGFMPNMPEAIIGLAATASIGAVWSSCSPDFGANGVVDRFGQIEPKVLLAAEGYYYAGKRHDCLAKLREVTARLATLERVVVVPYTSDEPDLGGLGEAVLLDDFCAPFEAGDIEFAGLAFNHPLVIMFSSGTTGVPKCIVHGHGGTLLQHLKELRLHTDVARDQRILYFTTCGWMMWNWLVSALACEATVLLYDGSPFHPGPQALFDYADVHGMNVFGTSAKYIDAVKKSGLEPRKTHSLKTVKSMLSTGSPLVPESFDFVYEHIKPDLCLSSISGGTDIVSCFVLGNPVLPVRRGEIQCLGLGMDVAALDENGVAVTGEKGELVCRQAFPSMPVGFWNDADGSRYHEAYFAKYPNTWCHGDFVELTEIGGMIIHGRSDAVLNPGGVRIGTAEIYRQVEQMPEVIEGIVVGQPFDADVRVVLFVRLADGVQLDDDLQSRIRKRIRTGATPRHVPARILAVPDIPRTRSGKIVELAVRNIVMGEPVRNVEALANPEALEHFRNRSELDD